ncbi:alpha/beta-hydrolase [Aspergillus spinulosporus]
MSTPPTLIFIPGSWHKPACYDSIITLLQSTHNLSCLSVTLPSTTGNPGATFKDDIDAASSTILSQTNHGKDVVVIAHSYGGMVGNSAIKDLTRPKEQDGQAPIPAIGKEKGKSKGYVIGLILIASGFTFTGLSFMDPLLGHPPPFWRANWESGFAELVDPPGPRELFYHDLPDEEAEYWVSQLTTQSLKALFEGGEYAYAGWKDVPTWYLGTVEDQGLPVVVQRMMVGMARGMGGDIQHRELQSSHSPFLSVREQTVSVVVEAVEAFTAQSTVRVRGTEVESGTISTGLEGHRYGGGEMVFVPSPTLWRPFTWLKFGIPLGVGHLLGRGIVIFTWGRRLWRSRFGAWSV